MKVVSKNLSKRLWELGLRNRADKFWIINNHDGKSRISSEGLLIEPSMFAKQYPAYSTDELLEVLPDYIYDAGYMLTIVKTDVNRYWVNYPNHAGEVLCGLPEFVDKNLAEALGKLCEYLLTHGFTFQEGKIER